MLARERSERWTVDPRRIVTAPLDAALSPALLPVLFHLVVAVLVGAGAVTVVLAAAWAWWLGLVALLVVPILVLTLALAARVLCEIALGVSLLTAQSLEMASGLSRMETTVSAMARDMPPLGFLRRPAPPVARPPQ